MQHPLQGSLVAMDSHKKRLRTLARAANRCGIGPMLSIIPGSIQETAAGVVDLPQSGSLGEGDRLATSRDSHQNESTCDQATGNFSVQRGASANRSSLWDDDGETETSVSGLEYDLDSLNADFSEGLPCLS